MNLLTVDNLSKVGVVALLCIILVTGSTGVWVWGSQLVAMTAEKDKWEQLALDTMTTAKKVSVVRMPIMSVGPTDPNHKPTADEVRKELDLLKHINKVN